MYDPCECFINHEEMLRRLLNILRQTQEECSDGDCTTDILSSSSSSTNAYTLGLIALLSAFAMLMFATRPNSLRSNSNEKPRNSGSQPQPPPPSVG